MVKRLNVPLNDDDYGRANDVKEELGLTWEEYIILAADHFETHGHPD